jgi:hypothetical protein
LWGCWGETLVAKPWGKSSSPPIVVLDEIDPDKIATCVKRDDENEIDECLIGTVPNWVLEISEYQLVDGLSDPNPPLSKPVVALLQDLVDKCGLGQTYLQSATDSGGSLLVGDPDLTPAQIECVRSAERPGLHLAKRDY